ncbi:MAG TPA: NADH-quinone oxidoreductase subunit NuoF [Candidatus Hydrothermia bacterium]|nr:NADH-quinone oxidoreductase subunit NuoF [Candidatus Hydrothermae bacterium]MDD3648492.1 NADH-quinone oxidoreductase subunit NuoF [Candidatus Hydrothermia bacterium]MDD5573057.1 NADH-quinone oxidoreductase subunit NuoF [Candidatus Hydrothermia bacterium]HOK23674.1 NADH-quinone oxidoreductase subunit NuoF [Candidatus Hydrothermia bacterium]HOL24315.1 NADH-quinone oxidoreductase subunit NuoF [Candidatus Hydrothermia bacterium]
MNSCGIAAGARETYEALEKSLKEKGINIPLKITGCVGMCYREPLVDIITEDSITTYGNLTSEKVEKLVESHITNNVPVEEWIVKTDKLDGTKVVETRDVDGFFSMQKKIVLENSGYIDPESIDEYIARDGYEALRKALKMAPEEIIEIIEKSGLRGRGGAGFPTGRKWKLTRNAPGGIKYLICNADEGDPGAFMDRNVLEGDPHRVIEGMIIGAYAIGAREGFIYVRAEYPLAIRRLEIALEQTRKMGFLGDNILGSGFSFEIKIKEGAGAFVCGEETALLASIEGRRGMPRPRPPFPAEKGLFGKPTNINNVETYANVPWIIRHGWETFASIGTEKTKGTKVFALAGKIARSGNVEVPTGLSLREIIVKIGGGTKTGKPIKAVQLGGPSGGCIPDKMLDIPVDYDSITKTGAIMGSGGMIVMDSDTCMVDVAKFFLDFTNKESCGKCTFCRLGTKRMWEILDKITKGNGAISDLEKLEELAYQVKIGSLCGLGQTAPNPVITTLKYFRDEYMEHVDEKKCRAKVCKSLIRYEIRVDRCNGCTACAHYCPVKAITGEVRKPHAIREEMCIRCGTCYEVCRFNAIEIVDAFQCVERWAKSK